ncbi:hypothetical protein G647_08078 [Cladophialophora carrionii CBS 160.54]|uniref:Xylanolytic transcriptional activator regulatory domain-containing protein n=1 Tax=Cladophialophora carrionii CBS 160.54 TaxID=1279043 RepID=V9D4Z0_9EURO|nr:uncharacterized protein G647_08078 [Cladophialophora carrionii CBS 160.54]ETI21731.1 hypothetical protein G647_08078 [Cladophialophora carrionii CBS 160.54]
MINQRDDLSPRSLAPPDLSKPSPASSHRDHAAAATQSPQESGKRLSEVYRERTSTYEVVDQLFREHNSTVRLSHTVHAIPGGSPDARSHDASGHYTSIQDVLGSDLPPSHVIEFCLESYLDAVHWFMILFHEPSLRAGIQDLKTAGFVRADQVSFLILVALVIAVGAKYVTKQDAEERCPGFDLDGLGTRFIRRAEERILDVFDEGHIEAIQIAIILSSYYIYHSRPNRSLALNGSAQKLAFSMGLHKESSWKMQDPVVREVWRRLCWALYTAEVFGAMSFGTPCNVYDGDWTVSFPGNIDDTSVTCPGFDSIETYDGESFGPVTIASYQRYKFRLYRIASSITRNIYLRSGATLSEVVGEIKAINQCLLRWEKCVPRELRLKYLKFDSAEKNVQQTARIFQLQALALQLSYDNIQLVLHRPLLTINRVPRWPSDGPQVNVDGGQGVAVTSTEDLDSIIKTSKYHCWVSSMSTSKIGEYSEILTTLQNTHGAAYVGIQSFTAGVVLGIFALSDPLSDQAHQAKRAVSRIIKLPRLHRFRTAVSDQCGAILEELVRLILAEEMKALLNESEPSREGNAPSRLPDDSAGANGDAAPLLDGDDVTMQAPEPSDGSVADVFELFSHETLELPRDIASGNFSDALVSLQDGKVFRHYPHFVLIDRSVSRWAEQPQ